MTNSTSGLREKIAQRKATVAIIGVGYVGLPLAVKLAETEFTVIGADKTEDRVNALNEGRSTVEGLSSDRVKRVIQDKKLKPLYVFDQDEGSPDPRPATTILEQLAGTDVFVVCVHTPLRSDKGWEPDIRWITLAAKLIRFVCEMEERRGILPSERLIILESTTYPGTTRSIFASLVEDFGKKNSLNWYLAYSPERTDPGPNAHEENPAPGRRNTFQIPRIVGGFDKESRDNAVALYESVFDRVEAVESLEAAEMIKLVENTFRFVSIGFANEMARIARIFGLNIWDIIRAAKTKDFGLDLCYPGLIGGHCIPIDPHYLSWAVRNKRRTAAFIDIAEKAHQDMLHDAVDLIRRLLNQNDSDVFGSRILFLGVAYKKNVADYRESAVLDLMKRMFVYGAKVSFWDPLLAAQTNKKPLHLAFKQEEYQALTESLSSGLVTLEGHSKKYRYLELAELKGTWEDLRGDVLGGQYDCIVIATDHDDFYPTYEDLILGGNAPAIADLRNTLKEWLRTSGLPDERVVELRLKLSSRRKYMLLGVD